MCALPSDATETFFMFLLLFNPKFFTPAMNEAELQMCVDL